jgi:hypothetical protein
MGVSPQRIALYSGGSLGVGISILNLYTLSASERIELNEILMSGVGDANQSRLRISVGGLPITTYKINNTYSLTYQKTFYEPTNIIELQVDVSNSNPGACCFSGVIYT